MRQGSLRLRLLAAGAVSDRPRLGDWPALAFCSCSSGMWSGAWRPSSARISHQLVSSLARAADGSARGRRSSGRTAIPPAPERTLLADRRGGKRRCAAVALALGRHSDLPPDVPAAAEVHQHTIPGPGGPRCWRSSGGSRCPRKPRRGTIRAAVALDRAEVHAAGLAFASDLVPSLALLARVLIAAAWVQVGVGLRPLDAVRRRLAQVRSGEAPGWERPSRTRSVRLPPRSTTCSTRRRRPSPGQGRGRPIWPTA